MTQKKLDEKITIIPYARACERALDASGARLIPIFFVGYKSSIVTAYHNRLKVKALHRTA